MKKLFSFLLVGLTLALTSCSNYPQPVAVVQTQPVQTGVDDYGNPTYEVVDNNGQQAVVVYNNDGSQFFMDYVIFNSLLNSGGWGSVYNTYNTNPGLYYNSGLYSRYSGWHHSGYYNYSGGRPIVINNYHGSSFHDYSVSHRYNSSYTPRAYRPSTVTKGSQPVNRQQTSSTPYRATPVANAQRSTPVQQGYKPAVRPQSNAYKPAAPAYKPAAPSYKPSAPAYKPTAPSYKPSSSSKSSYSPSKRH